MEWIEVRVTYDSDKIEETKEIIMDLFNDFGVTNLIIEEQLEKSSLDYYSNESLIFTDDNAVVGHFPNNRYIESKKRVFIEKLEELAEKNEFIYNINYTFLDDADWKDSWKKYFHTQKISDKIVIKPTWREYTPENSEEIVIEIDPKMAFGTGTHPTTYLCMKGLEKYIEKDKTVLDIGTGSGILMIAAEKLGAKKVYGIDIDEDAVRVAKENLILNNVNEEKFRVTKGDLLENFGEENFDIVVSNILAEIIVELLDDIKKVMNEKTICIFSGILVEKENIVVKKMKKAGLELIDREKEGEWMSIVGRKK